MEIRFLIFNLVHERLQLPVQAVGGLGSTIPWRTGESACIVESSTQFSSRCTNHSLVSSVQSGVSDQNGAAGAADAAASSACSVEIRPKTSVLEESTSSSMVVLFPYGSRALVSESPERHI